MRKFATSLAVLSLAAVTLAGCATSNQAGGTTPSSAATGSTSEGTSMKPTKKEGPLKIAFVPVVMNTSYDMVLSGLKEEVERNGGDSFAQILVQAPSGNTSSLQEQPNIMEGLVQQDVDAIALATEDQNAMLPYIKAASEKGIPVFLFNMSEVSADDPYYVTNVSFDQYGASHQIGEWAIDHFGDAKTKVAVLEGFPGVVNTQRLDGFMDAIKDSDNFEVVASQAADWTRAKGQSVTENILQANPDVNFIYGLYDEMALGAVAAVKGSGKLGDIVIAGYDNTKDGYESIKAGELSATVDTASKAMGVSLVQAIKSFVVDGKPIERSIMEETNVYDQDNIDEFDTDNYIYVPQG
jgi:ABC-type sugar transport system substrate-binding protein